ncbi:MAG TPA: zf-TFIIB domain-containing protein [Thermoanaerobaculia bacterium]|nr:zf-TFIIB domain-containing protein [Thermoanaerobaculia bacterium]
MNCPVCANVNLLMTDRQGIEIDYCPQCRGVWLDRGELDKLIEKSLPSQTTSDDRGYSDRTPHRGSYDSDHSYRGDYPKKKRKEGFLSDLFDF